MPLSSDPIEDSFHRGRMSAAQAAAARLAARGTSAAKVKAGAAADVARDQQFQRQMSAGGTQIDPVTAARAQRNHATLDQVTNANKSAIPAAVAGASDAVFGATAPAIDAGGARYTNRGKGSLQYLTTLFGGAPPDTSQPQAFTEAATSIGDAAMQRGNENLGVDTNDPNIDLGQAITRLIAGTTTPVPLGHEMAGERGEDITPSVLDHRPADNSILPPSTSFQDHRAAQIARQVAQERGWRTDGIGVARPGDAPSSGTAVVRGEPEITPYELSSGVPEPPAPTQSMAADITRPADEPIPPPTLRQRGMGGRSGPVEQAELRGSSNGTPVPDDGLWYYDNVGEALKDWQSKGTPEQLMAHLKKYKGAADEADEIGLQQWLGDKKSVTKAEVQNYLDENKVQVNEVWKGNGAPASKSWRIELDPAATDAEGTEMFSVIDPDGNVQHTADFYDAQDYVRDRGGETARQAAASRSTKYDDYQLPGGENYRELLLTKQGRDQVSRFSGRTVDANGRTLWQGTDIAQHDVDRLREDYGDRFIVDSEHKAAVPGENAFYSSHWDEPNILAHVRMNDRVIDGKKILHVEEVQSDWHQAGRKKGYDNPEARRQAFAAHAKTIADKDAFLDEMVNKHNLPNDSYWRDMKHYLEQNTNLRGDDLDRALDRANDLEVAEQAAREAHRKLQGGIADAPFKGAGWKKLAMKRILKYAADNNYDGVTWTTGAQQAERYNLSKHVHTIGSLPLPEADIPVGWPSSARGRLINIIPHQGDRVVLHVDDSGKVIRGSANADQYVGKDLSDIVGKDLAEKLVTRGPTFTVSGEGLNIGGEGMKGFYDKELPNITNDLLKKHGVKSGQLGGFHHVDVPAKLKSSKLPLFAVTGAATALGAAKSSVTDDDPISESFHRGRSSVRIRPHH